MRPNADEIVFLINSTQLLLDEIKRQLERCEDDEVDLWKVRRDKVMEAREILYDKLSIIIFDAANMGGFHD